MAVPWEPPRERDRVRYKPFRPFGSHSRPRVRLCLGLGVVVAPRPLWDRAPIGSSILARRNVSDNEGREDHFENVPNNSEVSRP